MNNKLINITIRKTYGTQEILLKTNSKTWEKDIQELKKMIYGHGVEVIYRYEDGSFNGVDKPYRWSRQVITYNGRSIYANWNIVGEYGACPYDRIYNAFVEDFKTKKQPEFLKKLDKEYKRYMHQTAAPAIKKLKAAKVEVLDELKDE